MKTTTLPCLVLACLLPFAGHAVAAVTEVIGDNGAAFGLGISVANPTTTPTLSFTGTLYWSKINSAGSSLADLATRNFSDLQSKPTTLAGYGITDATNIYRDIYQIDSDQIDSRLVGKTPGADQDIFSTRNDTTSTYVRKTTSIIGDVDVTSVSVWNNQTGGVPLNSTKTVTLISPDIGISAEHHHPPNGTTVRFVDNNNLVTNLIVGSSQQIGSTDIRVIKFTTAAPSTIRPTQFLLSDQRLLNAPAFWLNQTFKAYVVDLSAVSNRVSVVTSPDPDRGPFSALALVGDSSHPIFAVLDGRMVLLAVFHTSNSGDSISWNYSSIIAAASQLSSVHQITPFPINPLPGLEGFGNQVQGTVLRAPATGSGIPAFLPIVASMLPSQITLGLTRATFSNENYPGPWPGISTLAQVGTLNASPHLVTLPTVGAGFGVTPGRVLTIQDESGTCSATNRITVQKGSDEETIDGLSSVDLTTPYAVLALQYTGSKWKILWYRDTPTSEYVSALVGSGNAVALTTNTGTNVLSVSLTAGDWDVEGNVNFAASSATVTGASAGISKTSGVIPRDGSEVYSGVQVVSANETDSITLPRKRLTVTSTATIYLVGKASFSAGALNAFGGITARRVR